MAGLGTIINAALIITGGIIGIIFRHSMTHKLQETLMKANAVAVIFIGISGALAKMLTINNGVIETQGALMMIISLAFGAIIGELIDLEHKIEQFGEYLKKRTGNAKDRSFTNAFVTASLTVCIGAMAIVGAIEDGLYGDHSILIAKGILDFIIIMIMTASLGKGALFSFIPVGIFQGLVTIAASFAEKIATPAAMNNLSLVGSILIFCVGVNLIWENTIRVGNVLPAIFIAFALAFCHYF